MTVRQELERQGILPDDQIPKVERDVHRLTAAGFLGALDDILSIIAENSRRQGQDLGAQMMAAIEVDTAVKS